MKLISLFIAFVFLMIFSVNGFCGPVPGGEVTLAWDANTEPDMAGYKIYYGNESRFDPALLPVIEEIIAEKCGTNQSCIDLWRNFCGDSDPACDQKFFKYGQVFDVGNVTTHTLSGLIDGVFYFAATAYDNDGNESIFSKELSHRIDTTAPGIVLNFSGALKKIYKISVEEIISP